MGWFGFCYLAQSCWLDITFEFLLFDSPESLLYRHTIMFLIVVHVVLLLHILCMPLSLVCFVFPCAFCVFSLYVVYGYYSSDKIIYARRS